MHNTTLAKVAAAALCTMTLTLPTGVAYAAPVVPVPNVPVPHVDKTMLQGSPADILGTPTIKFWNNYCQVNLELQNAIDAMNRAKSPTITSYKKNIGGGVDTMRNTMRKGTMKYRAIGFIDPKRNKANRDMAALTSQTAASLDDVYATISHLPNDDVNRAAHTISYRVAPRLTNAVRHYSQQSSKLANKVGTGTQVEQIIIAQLGPCKQLIAQNKKSGSTAEKKNAGHGATVIDEIRRMTKRSGKSPLLPTTLQPALMCQGCPRL